jgi:anti-sigma regulatory factor (Ser/Thr protein kinase)
MAAGHVATMMVPNRLESVRPAVSFFLDTARELQVAAASSPLFEVAVTEALTNAVKYGHSGEEGAVIVCQVEYSPEQLTLRVIDEGPGFNPSEPRLASTRADQVEALPESGYGLPIIRRAFPIVRAIRSGGRFGLELVLPF